MDDWSGLALWLLVVAIPGAGLVACAAGLRRCLRWHSADAVVCPDTEHPRLPPAQPPRRALTVMFESPCGPCTARLSYLDEEAGFPVGSTIRVVFNPAKPTEVAFRHSIIGHAIGLLFFGAVLAFLLALPWRIGVAG
ncbi:hypothetical protein G3576_22120 [Roseomonas stagni]|uniref:DUF3592 domain-containing protein n=1 Tax=Falsiroseomonas algicola TaxID=2716930 RepID=A0A6M1LQP3_9PROT|nr:DUF3592 domain-containing protein [Falsiroseomonas algicola]NGM22725.1 hypothetical protein [Falsiroseomonas algicola]